jgi:O-antigen ligase
MAGWGLGLLGLLLARPPVNRLPGLWLAACAGTAIAVTTFIRPWPVEIGSQAITWTAVYAAAVTFSDPTWCRRCIQALCLGLVAVVGLALAQFLVGHSVDAGSLHLAAWGERFGRVGGLQDPVPWSNSLVPVALILLLPAADLGLQRPGQWRTLVGMALLLARVRMGLLATLFGAGAWYASANRRGFLLSLIAVPVVGFGLVGVLAVLDWDRLQRLLAFEDGRWVIWRTGWQVFVHNPLLGSGPGVGLQMAFVEHFAGDGAAEFGSRYLNLHNTWLTIAASHGLGSLLLWLAWFAALLWGTWRGAGERPHARRLLLALVVATVVLGSFDHLLGRPSYHLPLYLALGLALGLGARRHGQSA